MYRPSVEGGRGSFCVQLYCGGSKRPGASTGPLAGGQGRERERESNVVAHELAALARRNTHTAVWLGQVPACVADLTKSDCKPSIKLSFTRKEKKQSTVYANS